VVLEWLGVCGRGVSGRIERLWVWVSVWLYVGVRFSVFTFAVYGIWEVIVCRELSMGFSLL